MRFDITETPEGINKRTPNKSYNLIYIILIIAPILYVVILLILQIRVLDEINVPKSIFSNNFLNIILFLLILMSITEIIITYKIFIPLSYKKENVEFRESQNVLILCLGGPVIATYGMILGILWWDTYNFVPFYLVLPFIGVGIFHGYYLYSRYILKENIQKNNLNEKG